jgi:hypothetical protein
MTTRRAKGRLTTSCMMVFLVVASSAWSEDRRSDKSVLTIMTLNAEFLWDALPYRRPKADTSFANYTGHIANDNPR